jgi:hypothetical protein
LYLSENLGCEYTIMQQQFTPEANADIVAA